MSIEYLFIWRKIHPKKGQKKKTIFKFFSLLNFFFAPVAAPWENASNQKPCYSETVTRSSGQNRGFLNP